MQQKLRTASSGNGVLFAPCDAIEPDQPAEHRRSLNTGAGVREWADR